MLTTVPIPGNIGLLPRSRAAGVHRAGSPRLPNRSDVGVISHLGPVREVSGAQSTGPAAGSPAVSCVAGRPAGKVSPMFRSTVHVRDAAPGRRRGAGRGLGRLRRPPRAHGATPTAHALQEAEPPRSPGSPPTRTSGCSWPASTTGSSAPSHLTRAPAVADAQRHRGLRHAPAGHRGLPPARRRPRAAGGHRSTWAEEKDTAHVVAAAAVASRDANRFMARLGLGADRRGPRRDRRRRCAPSCPWSRRRPPAWAARSHRNVGQVLVQRRSLRRARTRPPSRPDRPPGPPAWGWRRTRVAACPTSPPARTAAPEPTVRGCCCSTATRWPTARSSRCRWRTSRRPRGSTPTRSTASPRC